jgi:hypothetical protein
VDRFRSRRYQPTSFALLGPGFRSTRITRPYQPGREQLASTHHTIIPSRETENGLIMTRSLKRSNDHFQKAEKRLPVGVTSTFRYWGPENTLYVDHAKGPRVWDIDGNEYIDYRLGYGPTILGYCDPRVDAAARAGMETGGAWALSTQRELAVVERIAKMVPAAEMVRFANSGTEAVMGALRVARGYTGKDAHIMVEGGFHGLFDSVQWQAMVELRPDADGEPEIRPEGKGVPALLRSLAHLVPLNDANRLEDVMRAHGDEIGAFLIEPIMGNCCSISARRGQDRLPCSEGRRPGADGRARRSLHLREGDRQRLSDLRNRGPRGDHAQDRSHRRGPGRHVRGSSRVDGGRGEDAGDPR